MKIESIESLILDVPTVRPAKMAFATVEALEITIVRVRSTDGVVGIGEAATIAPAAWSPESAESVKLLVDRTLGPGLVGEDARSIGRLVGKMNRLAVGNWFAKSAVEAALVDLVARTLDVPSAVLLGGAVRDRIRCAWTLATGDTARDLEEADAMLESGRHRLFKTKVGAVDLASDIARVAAIRAHLPEDAPLVVDANQAWSETDARRACDAFDDAGVEVLEQPVVAWNLDALRRLRDGSRLTILADESLSTSDSAMAMAKDRVVDAFSLKPNKSGGLFATRDVAAIAAGVGIGCYGGSMLESAVGTAAALQVYSALPELALGCELFCPWLLQENVTQERIRYEDGCVLLPEGPGHGVTLDDEVVARLRRDR